MSPNWHGSQVLNIVSPNAALSPHYTAKPFSLFYCDELTVKTTIYRLK